MTLPQQAADAITLGRRLGNRPGRTTMVCSASVWKETSKWISSSPDGRTGIFRSTLAALPDTEGESEVLLKTCAQRAVAASRKRKSILSSLRPPATASIHQARRPPRRTCWPA